MNTDDKKPSNVQMTLENLSDAATNIREVDFKKHPNDIVQTIGEETEAILITYEKDKGELKLCLITYKKNLSHGLTHGCKIKIKFTFI